MQKLTNLPADIKQRVIDVYSGLEEFYFVVFYNRHEHYRAYKAHDTQVVETLERELGAFEDELEGFGVFDGHEITNAISSDFSENVARTFATNILGASGVSEEDIRQFIGTHLR